MRYDLAIFDFDGTLADSLPWFLQGLNEAARRFGFREITEDEMSDMRGREPAAIMDHLGMPMWKMPLVVRHVRGLMARDIEQIPLFEGVHEMLAALADAGVKLAMVSSNSEANVRHLLGPSAPLFAAYGCGASMFGKPAKFRKVMRRCGVPPTRTISIGDEVRDIEAARAVGASCGAVSWGYGAIDFLRTRQPDHVFESMGDIAVQVARVQVAGSQGPMVPR